MEDGRSGLGFGPQETFIACSDIAIHAGETRVVSAGASARRPGRRPLIGRPRPFTTTTTTTSRPITPPRRRTWHRHSDDGEAEDSDEYVPEIAFDAGSRGSSDSGCRSVGIWRTVSGLDAWCVTNCARGYCPASHCCCDC